MSTQDDEKLQAKIRKLMALAERGEGGERDNARRMLENMLRRHGLTLDDLQGDKREIRWFSCVGPFQRRLAQQILSKVTDSFDVAAYTSKERRSQIGVEVTASEAIEFELHFSVLKTSLADCFEQAYCAFVQANRIFAPTADDSAAPQALSEQDMAMLAMASAIQPTPVNLRLEARK